MTLMLTKFDELNIFTLHQQFQSGCTVLAVYKDSVQFCSPISYSTGRAVNRAYDKVFLKTFEFRL